mmetsp:Transcript_85012/g.245837  ORF Transcript_85012/g.245837 Transcript_85012/m.245837 type:complete len:307 (+) Transcript_85012:586-1506(+)
MLSQQLPDVWALGEFQRLRSATGKCLRRTHQRRSLVDAVAQREHVPSSRGFRPSTSAPSAPDLRFERLDFPLERRRASVRLVGRARGDVPDALDRRQQGREELLATELDPPPLSVRNEHDRPQPPSYAQHAPGRGGEHVQAIPLCIAEIGPHVEAQSLPQDPRGGQQCVVPIEHKERVRLSLHSPRTCRIAAATFVIKSWVCDRCGHSSPKAALERPNLGRGVEARPELRRRTLCSTSHSIACLSHSSHELLLRLWLGVAVARQDPTIRLCRGGRGVTGCIVEVVPRSLPRAVRNSPGQQARHHRK